jgi:outer membrane murein-binding lipoprotein Lpp
MRILKALLAIVVAVSLSGCGDKDAREYAARLIPVLNSYQEQLSQKIKAEQESYTELAKAFEEARKEDVKTRLMAERNRRSEELGEKISTAKEPPTLSQIFASLQDYAKSDFETTQSLLEESLDARSKYLADLESLEVELQKVKLLKEALKELAKSKSDFKQFKQAADFALKTDEGITKLLCADLKKQLDQLKAEKEAAEDEDKKAVEQKIKQTTERMSTKKCS